MSYRDFSTQYREWLKRKSYDKEHDVWIRKLDCDIAQRFFGYKWYPINGKQDFAGNKFSQALSDTEDFNAGYILEPDTWVPNYSSGFYDALKVANVVGMENIKVFSTESQVCEDICKRAISG